MTAPPRETITHQGETLTVAQWAARLRISENTLRARMRNSTNPAVWLAPRRSKPDARQKHFDCRYRPPVRGVGP